MEEEKCDVKLIDHPIDGWRLQVKGCENTLEKINNNLGKYHKRLFNRRVVKVEQNLRSSVENVKKSESIGTSQSAS